jgi:putative nucleotidyltransferase with HDIG domain
MNTSNSHRDANVTLLITVAACLATAALVLTARDTWSAVTNEPGTLAAFVALTLFLQVFAIDVYARGRTSVAAIGALALGFTLGVGPAMAVQVLAALLTLMKDHRVAKPHRVVFNAAMLVLAACAGSGIYHLTSEPSWTALERVPAAVAAGAFFWIVNIGMLVLAMSLAEGLKPREVWRERYRWVTGHYLAFGPLALATTVAYEKVGVAGLAAFTLPPALMILSVRQYLERTKEAVEEIRRANENLAQRNEDLQALFEFTGGLAARSHDRRELIEYAEASISRLTGGHARVTGSEETEGVDLVAGGGRIGALVVGEGDSFDAERWQRLRDAVLPQLATAVESAGLVEKVRRQHLATIAALSRSMEAKDDYTGGHVERVSELAVALAEHLGFTGTDLDAIEIGALLHDIGKIGIPESILRKPGPLDDPEWEVMRKHPIVSEYILSSVELPQIVLQIARSSHERIDGLGYPDGLAGDDIPLPARIVLVADALDALTSTRPYRNGRGFHAAFEEIRAHTGTQFCPTVVAALGELYRLRPMLVSGGLHPVAMSVA